MVDPGRLADVVCANLEAAVSEKQEVLEESDTKQKIKMVLQLLNREIEVRCCTLILKMLPQRITLCPFELQVLKLSRKIDNEVKGDLSKQQREFY